MKSKCKATLLVLMMSIINLGPSAHADTQSVIVFKSGDCGIIVENPHISESIRTKGINGVKFDAVKINVTSKCVYRQQKVKFEIELLKWEAKHWKQVHMFKRELTELTPSPFKVEVKDAYYKCLNKLKTKYWARARAWALIAGEVHPSPVVYSAKSRILACGT